MALATGLSAFLYSRKGYGSSSFLEQPHRTGFLHEEGRSVLPRVLDKAKIENTILIGHSDGASIAIIHAGSSNDDRIKGLILEAPHLFVEEKTLNGIRLVKTAYEKGNLRKRLVRYHGENTDNTFKSWVQVWLDPLFEDWNIEEYVPHIRVPVMALQGCADEYGTDAQIEALAKLMKEPFESVAIPDCGHSPHIEKEKDTLEAMIRFIERII